MQIPEPIRHAFEKADRVANGKWPLVWRFPVVSHAEAVSEILKPVYTYVLAETGAAISVSPGDNHFALVANAQRALWDIEFPPMPRAPRKQP